MANNQNPNIGLNNVANNLNQLVQQLMANANQPPSELHLVSYPDFYGGEQDPITWMEEVEQAFEANRVPDARKIPIIVPHLKGSAATWWINRRVQNPAVNRWDDPMAQPLSFKSNFLRQFRTVSLEGKWFSQLTQRKQGPTETVEQFYLIIEDLFRKVITGGNYFPEVAKAHIFLNGLRPELNRAVTPFMPNTLYEAYTRAKAFEYSYLQNPYGNDINSQSTSNQILTQLTEAVNNMSEQLKPRKPRNFKNNNYNNNNNGNKPQIICFKCNQPGHVKTNCPLNQQNNN
ncbi:13522_t:CDS:1, partial [Acaulospora morrowiae]